MTSRSFYTYLHKLKDGEIIAQKAWVRFRMSHIGTGSQYKGSGDEAYSISLEIRNSDCSWSNAKLVVIGNAHFSSMVPIYEAAEWDNFVDNNKITVKQRGKHILDLMCKPENKVKEIEKACLSFDLCKLEYKNGVLSSVNSRGERKPLFHRVVGEYTSIFEVQFNEEAKILLN